MNLVTLPLLTALFAGFTHALEADHMAAVTTFVSRRPHPLRALGFGVRWGLGHSLALLGAGGILIALDLQLPDPVVHGLELAVGVMLVGLGLWVMGTQLHRGTLGRAHDLAHAEGRSHAHVHPQGSTWVGAFHGLAGTAGFLALLPVAFISSPWLAGGYLLAFGLGTIVAMGLYALIAGLVFHRVGERMPALGTALRYLTGLGSVAVGVMGIMR